MPKWTKLSVLCLLCSAASFCSGCAAAVKSNAAVCRICFDYADAGLENLNEQNLRALVGKDKTSSGICFKPMEKSELFAYVSKHGALPKKTFSMGEGVEKRYYLEGKLIR